MYKYYKCWFLIAIGQQNDIIEYLTYLYLVKITLLAK